MADDPQSVEGFLATVFLLAELIEVRERRLAEAVERRQQELGDAWEQALHLANTPR